MDRSVRINFKGNMNTVFNCKSLYKPGIWALLVFFTLTGCKEANSDKNSSSMLCQGNYYTEEQAKEILIQLRKEYTSKEEWTERAKKIKAQILEGTGLEPFPEKCPLNPIMGSIRKFDGYQVRNVAFESLPGVYVTGSLYSPTDAEGFLPGVLSPHGHWNTPGDVGRYRPDAQNRFASIARMGAIVLAYDMVGYGQMGELGWKHKHSDVLKQQLWNSIRSVDFLISMGADPDKIACTGASGGGTQTFLLTAVDDRISVSVPVVQVSAHFFGGCMCESGMPIHKNESFQTNNVEIAALAAPRPMLLVSDGDDWTKNTVCVEFPHIHYIYGLLGKSGFVENIHFPDEKHDFGFNKRAAVYSFLAKHLGLDIRKITNPDGSINENGVVIEDQKMLYPFDSLHPFPANAIKTNDDVSWK
jgi:dienelactone hydrolase